MSEEYDLKVLREEIAKVTLEIIRLCGERLSLAERIGEIKARGNILIEDQRVEDELRRRVIEECRVHGIDSQFGLKILDLLIEESKRVQREARKLKS